MDIRNFKVVAQIKDRLDFTCEGKGRLVDWNRIEGYATGSNKENHWPATWKVIVARNGKQIKRYMKHCERRTRIGAAIDTLVARSLARIDTQGSGPLEDNKAWPANSKDKVAGSGPQSGPQGQTKRWPAKDKNNVARTVALPDIHNMDIQPGPRSGPEKDSLDIPEFLRR